MCALKKCAVFDLDGTLTQSEEGIFNCARYALTEMGKPVPDDNELRRFVGPPLSWSFVHISGLTEEESARAVEIYRSWYNTVGLLENRVYPGIRRLLRTLRQEGWSLSIATGKPTGPAIRIMEYFGLAKYFDRIIGAKPEQKETKHDLITEALPAEYDEAWMIGDRMFDIDGGRSVGIRTLGVGYGYGSEEELRNAGCDAYAATVQDVIEILCPGALPPRGMFLSMEGLDGSGKGTQLERLTDALDRFGFEVVRSREPGGCPISEKIRDVLLDRANEGMSGVCEALLYAASRAQHVHQVIRPAVEAGKVMLCDRFVDSSVAYQGGGRGLGVERILNINAPAVEGCMPLCTVYLDLDHTTSLSRRLNASEPDRLEAESSDFFARIEAAYRELIARDPGRFVVVDASGSRDEIARTVA